MYFGPNIGTVFRPPSEADSFLLRLTIGCSHNECTFCAMYKDVRFAVLTDTQIDDQIRAALKYHTQIRRIFLCDGDALVLPTEKLLAILLRLQREFPRLQRVASYGSPHNILAKSTAELAALRLAGLQLVYFGLETGSERLLEQINKGVTVAATVAAGQKIRLAGIKLSVTIINGLAGSIGGREHAVDTAAAVSQIRPDLLSALTMMLNCGTQYYQVFVNGQFQPLHPAGLAAEMKLFFESLAWPDGHCIFRSNHISNQFSLAGTIPQDIPRLIADCMAAESRLEKLTDWNPINDVDG